MSQWIEKALGEVTSYIAKGITPKYSDNLTENTMYVLNQKCNRNYIISYEPARIHDLIKKKISKEKLLKKGDVLINSTGQGTAGRVAQIWDIPYPTATDGHMITLRASQEIDKLYYGYAIKAHQNQIESLAEGSTGQTEINRRRLLEEVVIRFPKEKDVQYKIAHILENIDKKIAINKKINRNLSEQAAALYKSWFVDFEPFEGEKPDDWNDGTVDDLAAEIVCGKTPSTKKEEYYGEDVPFVTIPDMHGCIYTVRTERKLSVLGADSQSKKTLPKNSICVSCIGTAGLVVLLSEPSQTNQQINSIVPKANYSPYYIYLMMNTMAETINKLGQAGSTIVNLNKTQFGMMEVMIPSLSVMADFDEIVEPMFKEILSNQIENIKLSNLRDSLLPKLMSGELAVSDLDI